MARFDVFTLPEMETVLLLDVQADLFDALKTTMVIPLRPATLYSDAHQPRINPSLCVNGETYIMLTTDMSAIQRARLGRKVANLEAQYRDTITSAIDFLLTGF